MRSLAIKLAAAATQQKDPQVSVQNELRDVQPEGADRSLNDGLKALLPADSSGLDRLIALNRRR
jgi:hypothetical protein